VSRIFYSLFRSIPDLFHPRLLLLLFLPPLAALFLWGGAAYLFWNQVLAVSSSFSQKFLFTQSLPSWMIEWFSVTPESVAAVLAFIVAMLLIVPLTVLTSMLLTSVFAMPVISRYMERFFPTLEKKGTGVFVVSVANIIRSSLIYLFLWLLTLPLWMIPGVGVLVSLLLNGYLNYRLLIFDALGDYASKEEIKILLKTRRVDFLLLGILTSALVLIPPLFLILPIYSAICFARLTMLELQELRRV
jgi:CysZ protein